jgi:hypothetical protein
MLTVVENSKSQKLNYLSAYLKGPKHEIFGSGFFKPVWIGDLGTRTKNQKIGMVLTILYFSAL